jgi:hypothetical protein
MTRLHADFGLTPEDLALIETALEQSKAILSDRCLSYERYAHIEGGQNCEKAQRTGETLTRVQELLGRLHDQRLPSGSAAGFA